MRCIAILEDDFETAVVIDIGEREGAAVLEKVHRQRARGFGESAIVIVHEHDIARIAVPGVVGANQFVDGIPSALVGERGGARLRATWRQPASRRNWPGLIVSGPDK